MSTVTRDMTETEVKLFNEALEEQDWVRAAKMVAIQAHSGQVDKQGVAYIHHPERVAQLAGQMMGDHMDPVRIVATALMHDVVEDSGISSEDLFHMFPGDIAIDVEMLTRPKGMTYRQFIERLATEGSDEAITIKMADLEHNTDASRGPMKGDLSRRYHMAKVRLGQAIHDRVTRTFYDEWTLVPRDPSDGATDEQFAMPDIPTGSDEEATDG